MLWLAIHSRKVGDRHQGRDWLAASLDDNALAAMEDAPEKLGELRLRFSNPNGLHGALRPDMVIMTMSSRHVKRAGEPYSPPNRVIATISW